MKCLYGCWIGSASKCKCECKHLIRYVRLSITLSSKHVNTQHCLLNTKPSIAACLIQHPCRIRIQQPCQRLNPVFLANTHSCIQVDTSSSIAFNHINHACQGALPSTTLSMWELYQGLCPASLSNRYPSMHPVTHSIKHPVKHLIQHPCHKLNQAPLYRTESNPKSGILACSVQHLCQPLNQASPSSIHCSITVKHFIQHPSPVKHIIMHSIQHPCKVLTQASLSNASIGIVVKHSIQDACHTTSLSIPAEYFI